MGDTMEAPWGNHDYLLSFWDVLFELQLPTVQLQWNLNFPCSLWHFITLVWVINVISHPWTHSIPGLLPNREVSGLGKMQDKCTCHWFMVCIIILFLEIMRIFNDLLRPNKKYKFMNYSQITDFLVCPRFSSHPVVRLPKDWWHIPFA